jgi:amphi-Trp domain-containing protein
MGKETVLFSSEERTDIQKAAAFLRQLADKIAGRQVIFRQGENELVLIQPDHLILELKVEEELKSGREKRTLEIEFEWVEGDAAQGPVSLG